MVIAQLLGGGLSEGIAGETNPKVVHAGRMGRQGMAWFYIVMKVENSVKYFVILG